MKLDGFHFALIAIVVLLAVYFRGGVETTEGHGGLSPSEVLGCSLQRTPTAQEKCIQNLKAVYKEAGIL
jgi:hypothetical protein